MLFYKIIGMNVLLLTTNGRKSGKARTTPAMYVKQNQDFFIAAISPENRKYPNWYYNIVADPDVIVELFWRKRRYTAEPVNEKPEKLELIKAFPFGMIEAMHQYPPEEIPVIRLRPVAS